MSDYVAGICRMAEGGELIPFESVAIKANDDDDAVRQAVQWRVDTLTAVQGRTWLQVQQDGKSIYSQEIGRL